jgi:hypothetical protein
MVYLKQKDYRQEKMVLITGTVLIFIAAILGTQFMAMGKVYFEKAKFLENKGYEINTTVNWNNYDQWIDSVNKENFKGRYATDVREVTDWMEWYGMLKDAQNAAIYDDSLYGQIHGCTENYCLWFTTVNSRSSDGMGHLQTYVIFPQ